ncbi:MAG: cupin protein [Anaerocolumna sp.]|jgi:mannose-6-phosphate isomerase-like protein (cupin superfamily)|nr:cupin protein [Anaerocolumna sp.]
MKKLNVNDLMEFTKERSNRKEIFKDGQMDSGLLLYMPGQKTPDHKHADIDEIFYIISGSGTLTIDGEEYSLKAQDVIYSPKGESHGFLNTGNLNLVVLQIKLAAV